MNKETFSDELKAEIEEYSEGTERMQLNPSTDFYDEDYNIDYDSNNENEYNNDHDSDENDEIEDNYEDNIDYDKKRVDFYKDSKDNKDFMNEQGSGDGARTSLGNYKSNSNKSQFYLGLLEKTKEKKKEKTLNYDGTDEKDNDDDENHSMTSKEGSGSNLSNDDDEDNDDYDGFFSAKRKSNSRYFRKNTNDAIKIISTPLGKVGIVYQQTTTPKEEHKTLKQTFDFDSLKPAENSYSRSSSTHPKITPVLTADGKVALLYRGDSENTKYEPITNITQKFNIYDNKTNTLGVAISKTRKPSDDEFTEDKIHGNDNDDVNKKENNQNNNDSIKKSNFDTDSLLATTESFIKIAIENENDNSVLPMINRPLSEVLGIKKNQFKQFRIKDNPTTTQPDNKELSQTTVNLGEYSHQNRNYDFDFGLDRTMLNEQNNRRNHLRFPTNKNKPHYNIDNQEAVISSDVATDDILSKTEVVNLAIIPHFDEEFEQRQHLREQEANQRHHRQPHRYRKFNQDLSGVHCVMQAIMGLAAISAVFGMLGAFFKQRILDQIRMMQW